MKEADLVLVMERAQRRELVALYGEAGDELRLLSEFAGEKRRGSDIADPYQRSIAHFRTALEAIRESVEGLVRFLGSPA